MTAKKSNLKVNNTPRGLLVGDLHFKANNQANGNEAVDALIKLVENNTLDFVVLMGDVLHKHNIIETRALNILYRLVISIRETVPVYILVGNHDYVNNTQFMTEHHALNCFKPWNNVTVIDKAQMHEIKGSKFLFCPYVPDGRFIEAVQTVQDFKEAKAIFAHQTFDGIAFAENADKWPTKYPPVFSGHIHDMTILPNVYYLGAAYQHSYSEKANKKVWLVTFGNDIKAKKLSLGIKEKVQKNLNKEQLEKLDIQTLLDKNTVKINFCGTPSEIQAFKLSETHKNMKEKGIRVNYVQHFSVDTAPVLSDGETITFRKVLTKLIEEAGLSKFYQQLLADEPSLQKYFN